jgi:predicted nucleotidyltransferase
MIYTAMVTGPANGTKFSTEELKRIVAPIAIKHGVEKIYLFGSIARGDYNGESDYDFIIEQGKIDCIFTLSAFYRDLHIAIGYDIDVITKKAAESKPEFLKSVMKEGVKLFG